MLIYAHKEVNGNMFYRKCSKRRIIKVIPLVILCGTVMYVLTMWLIWESQSSIFNTGKKQVLPSKPGLLPAPKHSTGESAVKIQTFSPSIQTYSPSIRTCSLSILSLSGQRIETEICCDELTPRGYFMSWTKTQLLSTLGMSGELKKNWKSRVDTFSQHPKL